ncbi:cytochrome P450 [Apiospora arundinis]|uniref:Cytochrome P450 n=1 Tax=Apiospora arundinis TaxID=335852 RepID=A0ABR2IAJ2_9PEZI
MASASTLASAAWPSVKHFATLFVAGVGTHHLIRPYEIDSYPISICSAYLASLTAVFVGYYSQVFADSSLDAGDAILNTFALACAFNTGLFTSILVYRAFFHRLHHFPGPFPAKLTRFYAARAAANGLQMHMATQKMHEKYGDFVRTGPRHISILRPAAIPAIYGPTTNAGKPIDMTMYGMFYGFDVMSEVGFSKDFNMLKSGDEHPAIVALHDSLAVLSIVGSSMPWLLGMLTRIPGASGSYQKFVTWCGVELQARRTVYKQEKATKGDDHDPTDVISWLLKAEDEGDIGAPKTDCSWQEEARLLVVAGSDTTSTVLTNTLYFLAKYPEVYQKLQGEVDAALKAAGGGDEASITHEKIKDVSYLDWLVQETLRLKPAVPSGVTRLTPPEGLQIDEVRVPGDTIVVVPMHSIQRDPRYWGGAADANTYRPERWADLSTEKAAWMAFNRGSSACPGKNLAFMELRLILAKIAARFEVPQFAPGFDVEAFDHGAQDRFTMHLEELKLIFTER